MFSSLQQLGLVLSLPASIPPDHLLNRAGATRVHKLVCVYFNQHGLNCEQKPFTQESWDQFFQDFADQPEEEEGQPESVDDDEENSIILCD